jgi:hypothetical protein
MVVLQITKFSKRIAVARHHGITLGGESELLGLLRITYHFFGFMYQD